MKSKAGNCFNFSKGVKQGGVLFPTLFAVYVDNLLQKLTNSSVGCYVGIRLVGAVYYTNDIVLLALAVKALKIYNYNI